MRRFTLELIATIKALDPYRKAIVAFVVGVLQVLALYFTLIKGGITPDEVNILINASILALGGTVGVYGVSNKGK